MKIHLSNAPMQVESQMEDWPWLNVEVFEGNVASCIYRCKIGYILSHILA
jgi:hypothetical protein